MKYLERYSLWLHLLGWSVFVITPFLLFPDSGFSQLPHFKWFVLIKLLEDGLFILFFYLNLYIYTPALLSTKKNLPFLVALLIGFAACLFIPELLLRLFVFDNHPLFTPPPPPTLPNRPPPPPSFIPFPHQIGTLLSFSFVALVSSILALLRDRLREREEKQQIQLEKVAAELAVLKLQISPHFLFNTLNNLRWLTRQKSDKAEDVVVKLSQLLRYMVYEANAEKVPLSKEIAHLQHYIDLQKIRLTDKDCVLFECQGSIEKHFIEPLLFIPFVENAFKYGLHSQQSGEIRFRFEVTENTISFFSENAVFENNLPAEGQSGIGIQNVKRRLALHYPEAHSLKISQNDGIFRVHLLLQMNP
ncbi:sensor histidine kinase [Runella sp.]|uniref:sensor histidine kinase n=1 Tax=Runella sp. TaxID=1960881 RepID=UPI003D0E52CA